MWPVVFVVSWRQTIHNQKAKVITWKVKPPTPGTTLQLGNSILYKNMYNLLRNNYRYLNILMNEFIKVFLETDWRLRKSVRVSYETFPNFTLVILQRVKNIYIKIFINCQVRAYIMYCTTILYLLEVNCR